MKEYRITKYNPSYRNESGHYLDKEEWTSYSEVGDKVTLEEYLKVEQSYIESAIEFVKNSGVSILKVQGLEDHDKSSNLVEGLEISLDSFGCVLKALLREEFWCKLESKNAFIHVGYDFYMYIGVKALNSDCTKKAQQRGLFVEDFESPYK